jgi:hypothetical protein
MALFSDEARVPMSFIGTRACVFSAGMFPDQNMSFPETWIVRPEEMLLPIDP